VFFSPKPTFEDIVRKSSWVLPFVLLTLFSIGVTFAINQRINWREFMTQQIEKSPRSANMSAEQKQQQLTWCEIYSDLYLGDRRCVRFFSFGGGSRNVGCLQFAGRREHGF